MHGQQAQGIYAAMDTGAAYTILPTRLLRELGVAPMDKRRFWLADRWRIEIYYGGPILTIYRTAFELWLGSLCLLLIELQNSRVTSNLLHMLFEVLESRSS